MIRGGMAKGLPTPSDWQEARRWQALALKQQGWQQQRIAQALGVTKGAVSQWMARVREYGAAGLRARLRSGAPPRLNGSELHLLPELLAKGAEAYGFRGEVWTCARIGKLIERVFGVTYHKAHVSRLLKRLAWTPQKPLERATQRNEDRIEYWRTTVWEKMKKKARRERRTLVFVDESGFYLLPAVVRTYAPCGQTPVLRSFLTRTHLSVMGAVTSTGGLYTLVREAALTGKESGQFLQHLRRHVAERLLVIWDGASIHWATEVKSFLAKDGAKAIHLEPLPSYAPELNPVEGVWEHLKYVELRNLCCWNLPHLSTELTLAIRRLRTKPHLIRACFAGAGLSLRYGLAIYATLSNSRFDLSRYVMNRSIQA